MRLGDGVALADHGQDALLLNDGGLLKTEGVDTAQQVGVEVELLEGVDGLETGCLLDLDILHFLLFLHRLGSLLMIKYYLNYTHTRGTLNSLIAPKADNLLDVSSLYKGKMGGLSVMCGSTVSSIFSYVIPAQKGGFGAVGFRILQSKINNQRKSSASFLACSRMTRMRSLILEVEVLVSLRSRWADMILSLFISSI